jgi:hypothetical protein
MFGASHAEPLHCKVPARHTDEFYGVRFNPYDAPILSVIRYTVNLRDNTGRLPGVRVGRERKRPAVGLGCDDLEYPAGIEPNRCIKEG